MNGYRRGASWRALTIGLAAALCATVVAAGPGAATAEAGCKKANVKASKLRKQEIRAAIRCVINTQRGPNLRNRDQLREAAQSHTSYMRRKSCISHQCSGEPSLYERIRRTGYFKGARSYAYGEVIASNRARRTPRDIVRQWMGSSGHRAQLLSRSYKHLGVGASVRGGRGIYTVVLGSRSR